MCWDPRAQRVQDHNLFPINIIFVVFSSLESLPIMFLLVSSHNTLRCHFSMLAYFVPIFCLLLMPSVACIETFLKCFLFCFKIYYSDVGFDAHSLDKVI